MQGDKAHDQHFIPAFDREQETHAHEQSMQQSILTHPRVSPEDLDECLTEGVGTELGNLAQKEPYEEVERDAASPRCLEGMVPCRFACPGSEMLSDRSGSWTGLVLDTSAFSMPTLKAKRGSACQTYND